MSVQLAATVKFVDIPDEFTADAKVMGNRELEEKYGKSEATIVRWRRAVKVPSPPTNDRIVTKYSFTDPQTKDYNETGILLIEGSCVVASDVHVPYHDLDLCEHMVRVAEKRKIRQLAIVGDFFDFPTLSNFDPQDIDISVRSEVGHGSQVIQKLLEFFDRIYISPGNHCFRFLRAMKFQVDFPDVMDWFVRNPKVIVTAMPWMVLESGGQRFELIHPGTYSRVATRVSSKIADMHQSHVMGGHDHLFGMTISDSGKYYAIDTGGLFDASKLAYKYVRGFTTHPLPQSGFWTVEDGVPRGYPGISNWDAVLNEGRRRAA